jgi:peptide/nickel transport system substrate-binding protein
VLFRTEAPAPGLPYDLADSWLVIHHAAAYGPQDNAFDLGAANLTGPYRVTAFETRVRAELARRKRHRGVRPRTPRIRFEEVVDNDARTPAALSGEAHIVRLLPPAAAGQVERSRTVRLVPSPNPSCRSVYLNTARAPFDDVRVRQALARAVDRDALVQLAYDGRGTPFPSWLAANRLYPEARRAGFVRPDGARAAELLDAAGWRLPPGGGVRQRGGQPLRFRHYWFGEVLPDAEVLQAQWARVGAAVDVQGAADRGLLDTRRAAGDWEAYIEEWGTNGDPATVIGRSVGPDSTLNYPGFRDPELEALLAGFAGLLDPETRRQQAPRASVRPAEVVSFISVAGPDRPTAVHRAVRNHVPHFLSWGPAEVHPDLWVAA